MLRRAGALTILATLLAGSVSLGITAFTPVADAEENPPASPYSGDILSRSTLTGDWGGARNDLAAKGITLNASVTQVGQVVVSGGKDDDTWEYGGRGNLTGLLDTQKLGLWPGGFLTVELEGNWDKGVNGKTGALSPANTNQLFPIPFGTNVALPALNFAQFVSHYAGVFAGKMDTTSADANEFAWGKGDTQFMNTAFNLNPVALSVPYSTLAAGVIVLPTKDPKEAIFNLTVASATGKATNSGFDSINGAIFAGEGRVRTDFFGLTGHQLVGGFYSNKEYTSLDQRIQFEPLRLRGQTLTKQDGTWSVYYNFDQFLYETDKSAGKGVGLFGRFGASEGEPVPAQYMYSLGVGGKGLIPTRDLDRFGIGYYYFSVKNPTLRIPIVGTKSFLRDEWGFEAFYNMAITPWLQLTPDLQVIGPAQKKAATGLLRRASVDTAVVLGFRLRVVF